MDSKSALYVLASPYSRLVTVPWLPLSIMKPYEKQIHRQT